MSETDDAELFAAIESAGDLRGTLRWLSFLFQNDFDLYRVYHQDREIVDRDFILLFFVKRNNRDVYQDTHTLCSRY